MTKSRLSPLQERLLRLLAEAVPEGTLTGGAALAAFYTRHRATRDIDLFFHGKQRLSGEPAAVEAALRAGGIVVDVLQRAPAFYRLRATADGETTVVDLVADPVMQVEVPRRHELSAGGGVTLLADSPHEILVNKLSALLGRAEVRDLQDVQALLHSGEDLRRAALDAPRKDGGFSPLTLAWVLRGLDVQALARVAALELDEVERLIRFRDELGERLLRMAKPEDSPP